MAQRFQSNFITVTATGASVTTGAASVNGTIPLDSAGNVPRYIRIVATASAYFRMGAGAGTPTAVSTDLMVQPGDAVVLSVNNNTKFAALQVSAPGVLQVSPLENV
jgi:hypothetical protein